jgi:flagellar hook assembly protein FlgD
MRFSRLFVGIALLLLSTFRLPAQETTGGLVGTVKDQSGAVIPGAQVVVKAPSLVGEKQIETDGSGNFRFANLPPGQYNITVTAKNFRTAKRELTL